VSLKYPFAHRFVVDMFRQGSFFSYIVVEIGWFSEIFLSLPKPFKLTVISGPLDFLVDKRILRRVDG
jgi:hypothetical protein